MIYLIPIVLTSFGALIFDFSAHHRNSNIKNLLWSLISFILILIIGLRYGVGGDTWAYMGDYEWRVSLERWEYNLLDPYQPGYTLLCAVGKSISPEFYVFQLIHASIVNILLFYFIKKNTKYIFSALIAVFFTCYLYFTTEILREVLAVLVFVLNYKSLSNRQWIKYYIGVLLACCFHISAIFLVLIPLLGNLKFGKGYFLIMVCTWVCMFFLKSMLNILAENPIISDKIVAYQDDTSHGMLADFLSLFKLFIFPMLYGFIVKYICKKELKFENPIAIMTLFGIAAYFRPIIFSRATNYFILFFAISISSFCVRYLGAKYHSVRQYATMFTIAFFMFNSVDNYMYGKYKRWYPYYSIWNPVNVDRDNYGRK